MNRRVWLLLLIGLTILTLACGVATVVVEEPTTTPTKSVMTPTATTVPPTVTPVPPTDTPTPPPEAPTSTPSSLQVISQATGACQHPYFPVRSDTVWQYQTQMGADAPMAYSVTYDDIGAESFTSRQTFPGATAETLWLCSDEGLIPSEIATFLPFEFPGFEFETLDFSGALVPPPGEWEVGATWETGYIMQVTTKVLGLSISSGADISVDNQIAAVEQVVVPAGTYPQAVRVDSTGMALVNMVGSEMETPFSFSHWYVEGVGLVKIAADIQGGTFDMELLSVEQ
jgi:hypothetical protein